MKEMEPCNSPEVRTQMPRTVLGPKSRHTVPKVSQEGSLLLLKLLAWKLMVTELLGSRRPKCFNAQCTHPSIYGDSWLTVRLILKQHPLSVPSVYPNFLWPLPCVQGAKGRGHYMCEAQLACGRGVVWKTGCAPCWFPAKALEHKFKSVHTCHSTVS